MSEHREAARRAPWDRWWVLLLSTAALAAVVVALVISALGGGQSPHTAHPAHAAATARPTASAHATASARPTASAAPTAAAAPPGAGGHVRYTGAATGAASFASAACIIGDGTVAEVDAPAPTADTAVTLSMTRTSGGLSVLLTGKYLHSGATPGVTVQHAAGRWSVRLQDVQLTGEGTGAVTLNGVVDCTQTNEPG